MLRKLPTLMYESMSKYIYIHVCLLTCIYICMLFVFIHESHVVFVYVLLLYLLLVCLLFFVCSYYGGNKIPYLLVLSCRGSYFFLNSIHLLYTDLPYYCVFVSIPGAGFIPRKQPIKFIVTSHTLSLLWHKYPYYYSSGPISSPAHEPTHLPHTFLQY